MGFDVEMNCLIPPTDICSAQGLFMSVCSNMEKMLDPNCYPMAQFILNYAGSFEFEE